MANKLTKWEIGQDLIVVSDIMAEKVTGFAENDLYKLADELNILRAKVGDLFNKNNSHDFGIFDSDCETSVIATMAKPKNEA